MMVALDRSLGLLEFARTQTGGSDGKGKGKGTALEEESSVLEECLRADLCFNGWRSGVFVSFPIRFILPLFLRPIRRLRTFPSQSQQSTTYPPLHGAWIPSDPSSALYASRIQTRKHDARGF